MYLHFVSLINTDMAQAIWHPSYGKQGRVCSTWSIPWVLMIWWFSELGHQQPWYWPCSLEKSYLNTWRVKLCKLMCSHDYSTHRLMLSPVSVFRLVCFIIALRPNDAIWQHRSGSTLAQVMDCCLVAPNHHLNKCWLVINGFLWHSPKTNFTGSAQVVIS